MSITRAIAVKLHHGQTIYHKVLRNADGSAVRARVNGKPRTWVTRPYSFCVPCKRGLVYCFDLTPSNATEWSLTDPTEPARLARIELEQREREQTVTVRCTADTRLSRTLVLRAGCLYAARPADDGSWWVRIRGRWVAAPLSALAVCCLGCGGDGDGRNLCPDCATMARLSAAMLAPADPQ